MDRKITVILPTKNRHDEVGNAIASVVNQLLPGDEVLVIDDGSTPPISTDHADCVRVLRVESSLGPAGARNLGILRARNPVLAFLDSDDTWLDGKLEAQRAILPQDTVLLAVVMGWYDQFAGQVIRKRIPKPARTRSEFYEGCWYCPGSTLLISREAFSICGLYDENLRRLEDYEWFLRFALKGGRLEVVRKFGSVINRGMNNKPALVEHAAAYIRRRYAHRADITPRENCGMMAYLHLELAGSYRNEKNYFRALMHIFISLAYRPRLSLQVRNWWSLIG